MALTIGAEAARDFERSSRLEWLETNGLGGWAGSTVSGAHTRRYHGLLVAATRPPTERTVLLSRLDETVRLLAPAGEAADGAHELGAARFPDVVHPRGFELLESFERDLFPVFTFVAGAARLRRTIAAVQGENTTLVLYQLLAAPAKVRLELRPLFAGRHYHALGRATDGVARDGVFADGTLVYQQFTDVPPVFLSVPGSRFTAAPDWFYDYQYQEERERGFEAGEDLFSPGSFSVELAPGGRLGVIVSTEPAAGRDAHRLFDRERSRRSGLLRRVVARADAPAATLLRPLVLAADQFIVRRGKDATIIAGYPWFTDWGRDTMIALPGLCLATRRFAEAKGILHNFARATSEGMLPNRFPDRGEAPEYNTADASLLFFVAVHRYLEATGDAPFVRRTLLPVLRDILAWHRRGTRHGIHQDQDGLLCAGEPGVQVTWMDAKIGDWVVTPRLGKPVEINALWGNAIAILADLEAALGDLDAAEALRCEAVRIRQRFEQVFWYREGGYLYDVVADCDRGANRSADRGGAAPVRDPTLRPNQLLALSLPFAMLEGERAASVLEAVERRLLTPLGLRTLPADDPAYRPRYLGGPAERDSAYHQGTVWPWLLGPYLTALVRVRGAAGRASAATLLRGALAHLTDGGVGTISEICDAEPPHTPRGCFAQAWSVGELLRAALEDAALLAAPQGGPRAPRAA